MRVEKISVGPAVLEVAIGGSGDTVVLIPYAGGDVAQFDRFAPLLHEAGFQTVAVNPRGVSESTGPLEVETLHELAADVAGVIGDLGPAPVHVLGASFGTRVARCLAVDRPELVRTLILVGAVGLVTSNDPEAVAAARTAFRLDISDEEWEKAAALSFFSPRSDSNTVRQFKIWHAVHDAQIAASRATPLEEWSTGGRAPILVIEGLDDRVAPGNGRDLRERLGERVTVVELAKRGTPFHPGATHGSSRSGSRVLERALVDPFELVDVGDTGLRVTRLGLGGAPLGTPPPILSDEEAVETIRRALSLGMRYVDTAAYGEGRSEVRYGEALAGIPRDSYVISTKVGVVLTGDGGREVAFEAIDYTNLPKLQSSFDFSRDGVLRAFESSLQRLRLDRVDMLFLHVVPEMHYQTAVDQGFPALAELRDQGVVNAIGAGLTPLHLLLRFVREADFDCFLLPNRYTLTEQTAIGEFLPLCQEKGISIIIGAPYNNGRILGRIADHVGLPDQSPDELAYIERYRTICDRYEVPIKAAALQFVMGHPSVVSVIPGPVSMAEMTENVRMMQHAIPSELWADMVAEGLILSDCPLPAD